MEIKQLVKEVHENAVNKGFWDKGAETGTLLMLCVSELGEALEADRKGRYAKKCEEGNDKSFEGQVKDTFEDELADTIIRIFDICGAYGIDIEKHIEMKMSYNSRRPRLHGKKY